MFKKDIFYKLTILIICFTLIAGLCAWKSKVYAGNEYDIDHYNLLNEVKSTETSDQLLEINENDHNQYIFELFYKDYKKKHLNDSEEQMLSNNTIILSLNLNGILNFLEKENKNSDLEKDRFKLIIANQKGTSYLTPTTIEFSNALYKTILSYKDQLERFKKLEINTFTNFKQLNDILKTDFCDLNEFLLSFEKTKPNILNKSYVKIRKILMRFYGILFKLYGENKTKRLVSNFSQEVFSEKNGNADSNVEKAGVTIFSRNIFKQQIKIKGSAFCTTMCGRNYRSGFWSSPNCVHILIHELGHAIDTVFALDKYQSDKLHTTCFSSVLPLFKNVKLDSLYSYCSSLSIKFDELKNSVNLQKHIDQCINQPQFRLYNIKANDVSADFKKEAIFAFAPSKYARTIKDGDSTNGWKREFFAECFAYWMLTPDKFRDIRWAIINDYFLNEFGK